MFSQAKAEYLALLTTHFMQKHVIKDIINPTSNWSYIFLRIGWTFYARVVNAV